MKMKIKFKRCLVSLLSLSLLFLSCNCLGVNAAEGDNSDGSQNISVTDVTESSGEENTSSGQNTETTEASTEATQGVTDKAESDETTIETDSVEMNLNSPENSNVALNAPVGSVCYMTCDGIFVDYFTDVKVAVDYAKNNWSQGDFIINLLNQQYYFSNNIVDVQMADVTIQPDPSFGENKCIVYRGASTQDLFRVQSTATLTLKNLILDGRTEEDGNIINRVQARMIWSFGNVNLDNCEFRYAYNLNGPAKGGVIRMEQDNNRELIISDCYFHDNVVEGGSANGAAISAEYCKTTITSSKFENNTVKSLDSSGGGGAIYVYGRFRTAPGSQQYVPNLILADVELIENRVTANATTDLDKLKVGGGGIYVTEHAWVTLDGCTITGNSAPTGGGIFYNFGIVDIADTDITGNTADKIGGGIFFNNSVDAKRFSVRGRVVIDGNTATNPQIIGAGTPYPSTVDINFGNNVMLYNSTNDAPQSISVVGNLTDGSSIGITAIDSNNH